MAESQLEPAPVEPVAGRPEPEAARNPAVSDLESTEAVSSSDEPVEPVDRSYVHLFQSSPWRQVAGFNRTHQSVTRHIVSESVSNS